MKGILLWIRAMRAPFFQAAVVPVIVGTAIAWWETGAVSWLFFLLAAVANAAVNAGTNLANDYYDHVSTDDVVNPHPTQFSGGSRVIQEGLVTPRAMLVASVVSFTLALALGVFLAIVRGLPILWIGLIGMAIGFFYTAPPFKLAYRGMGEIAVFLALGPLSVLGAYYVQTQAFSAAAVAASIPVGLLVAGILYINQFPDYEPDRSVGKNNLIVLLGRKRAAQGYLVLIAMIYLSILVPVLLGLLPAGALLAFVTLPLAAKAVRITLRHYDTVEPMIPAMAATIQLHLLIGLLLPAGCLVQRLGGIGLEPREG